MHQKRRENKILEECKLVERMKAGDRSAFDLLYERYCNQLLRMATLILGNQADSEDVVQETFVKCYVNCKDLKDCNGFRSWLFTILTRTAWQYGKKMHQEIPDEEIERKADGSNLESSLDIVIQEEQSQMIYRLIHGLDMKHRTVIVYYYYNQMSTKEIARLCGCLEGTIKSRLFHARKILKEEIMKLEQEDIKKNEKQSQCRRENNPSFVR